VRPSPVLDPMQFSVAERSALRLDGECVPLGLSDVPVGMPIGPAERAASLAAATCRYDLVVELRSAAWVHGAAVGVPSPLTLAMDVERTGRRSLHSPAPREVRFRRADLERIGGVLVTTPLRTAFDLLRLVPDEEGVAATLVRMEGLAPPIAAALAQLFLRCPGKERGIERLAALPAKDSTA
jgi:hypothetical protein